MLKRVSSSIPLRKFVASSKLHSLALQSPKPSPSTTKSRKFKQNDVNIDATKQYLSDLPGAYNAQIIEKAILTMGLTLATDLSKKVLIATSQEGRLEV